MIRMKDVSNLLDKENKAETDINLFKDANEIEV